MKRFICVFFLLATAQVALAQNKSVHRDELLFEKGYLLHEMVEDELKLEEIIKSKGADSAKRELAEDVKEALLEKALTYYQELIDSFPQSKLLFRALNNKASIELALDNKEDAIQTYKTILKSHANDMEKGGIGTGLMGEPYANYKNRAATVLAHTYLQDSNYKEALKYLDLTEKYPYRHFCGNEHESNALYKNWLYARCYVGLHKPKKALEILLPHIMENGLANNSHVVELAYQTLIKEYRKEDILLKYEEAFKNVQVEKKKIGKEEHEVFYINFLDTRIEINSWLLELGKPEEQQKEIESICKTSKFYKLLTK